MPGIPINLWIVAINHYSHDEPIVSALAPGLLSVFRQQLALYLRAEGRRRGRMEKGEKSVEPEEPKGPLVNDMGHVGGEP